MCGFIPVPPPHTTLVSDALITDTDNRFVTFYGQVFLIIA